ncbi:MAG: hypothetical protein V7L02_06990 [Nostoc sp.]|uniref:hypothetical protein n=1 Tax=Nostoc sp. TaxID=1180 RepID=UPI002FF584EF
MLLAYIPKRATHINHSHIEQVNEEKERSLHDQTEVVHSADYFDTTQRRRSH